MSTRAHHALLLTAVGSGAITLREEILADSPDFYFRLGETSGLTAVNETGGTDGTYSGVTLNQSPLYIGGPSSVRVPGGVAWVAIPESLLPAATNLTLMCIINPQSVSGEQAIIVRDNNIQRYWQFRMSGTSLQWVKIVGGVEVVTKTSVFAINVTHMLHVVITAAGGVEFFLDGALIHTATIGGTDYGGGTGGIRIGYDNGPTVGLNAYVSEVAGFSSVLTADRVLAHAEAAGFA